MSPPVNTTIPWKLWQETISDWAAQASGLEIVWARQSDNPVQARKPYVLLDVQNLTRRGNDGVKMIADPETGVLSAATYGIRRFVLNVQIVANAHGTLADSALAWAEELQNSIDTGPFLKGFVAVGLGVSEFTEIRDLGGIEQSQYVSRATFDVIFEGAVARLGSWQAEPIARAIGNGDVEGNTAPDLTFDTEN